VVREKVDSDFLYIMRKLHGWHYFFEYAARCKSPAGSHFVSNSIIQSLSDLGRELIHSAVGVNCSTCLRR
jgi:hypothetical protein